MRINFIAKIINFIAKHWPNDWKDLEVLYVSVNIDYNHWMYNVIYLNKRFIKLYDSLDTSNLKDKCNHIAILIPTSIVFLGYYGDGENFQSDPYTMWPIFVVEGVPK